MASQERPEDKVEESNPECPQCGSDDTAPIHQEPMWVSSDQSDPRVREQPWHRCLTCRHKWKDGEEG